MDDRHPSLAVVDAVDEKQQKDYGEPASLGAHLRGRQFSVTDEDVGIVQADQGKLHRNLKGRHMQMISMSVVSRLYTESTRLSC